MRVVTEPARALRVDAPSGPAFVQDGGRAGRMHQGVPPGGALVPEWLARANLDVGNAAGAAAVEAYAAVALVVEGGAAWLSLGDGARRVRAGERVEVPAPDGGARVRYVAVDGGLGVPRVLGGRGALVGAALPATAGRALRRGDVLALGPAREPAPAPAPVPRGLDLAASVRVILGPDHEAFAPDAAATLEATAFVVDPRSDRVGVRLRGAALARRGDDRGAARPMVRGAIQVPASGEAIVLGPDHPTTGGYPVVATIVSADLGAFFARRVGAGVRFRVVAPSEARAAWIAHAARWFAATDAP